MGKKTIAMQFTIRHGKSTYEENTLNEALALAKKLTCENAITVASVTAHDEMENSMLVCYFVCGKLTPAC